MLIRSSRQNKYLNGCKSVKDHPCGELGKSTDKYNSAKDMQPSFSHAQSQTIAKRDYQSLPAEIQNDIARHALVSGQVHLPPVLQAVWTPVTIFEWSPEYEDFPRASPLSRLQTWMEEWFAILVKDAFNLLDTRSRRDRRTDIGVGLLSANRRCYEDFHSLYWGLNTFYLPRGPVAHSQYFWGSIRPEHKALVRSIAIQFSLDDLVLEVLDHIGQYTRVRRHVGRPRGRRPNDFGWASRRWYIRDALIHIWDRKLGFIRTWSQLDELRLEAPLHDPLIIRGCDLSKKLGFVRSSDGQMVTTIYDVEIQNFYISALVGACNAARQLISSSGWKAFKETMSQPVNSEYYKDQP